MYYRLAKVITNKADDRKKLSEEQSVYGQTEAEYPEQES